MKCSKRLKKITYPRFNLDAIIDKAHQNLKNKVDEYIFDQFVKELQNVTKNYPNVEVNTVLVGDLLHGNLELLPESDSNIKCYLNGVPIYVI